MISQALRHILCYTIFHLTAAVYQQKWIHQSTGAGISGAEVKSLIPPKFLQPQDDYVKYEEEENKSHLWLLGDETASTFSHE